MATKISQCGCRRPHKHNLLATTLADTIVDSLKTPSQPKHCIEFYNTFLCMVSVDEPATGRIFLRYCRPDVLETLMRFVEIKRSRAEWTALEARIGPCRCPPSEVSTILHGKPYPLQFGNTIKGLVDMCCYTLIGGLHWNEEVMSHNKSLAQVTREAGVHTRKPWPAADGKNLFSVPSEKAFDALWRIYRDLDILPGLLIMQLAYTCCAVKHPIPIHKIPNFVPEWKQSLDSLGAGIATKEDLMETARNLVSLIPLSVQDDAASKAFWRENAHDVLLSLSKALKATQIQHSPFSRLAGLNNICTDSIVLIIKQNRTAPKMNFSLYPRVVYVRAMTEEFESFDESFHSRAYEMSGKMAATLTCFAPGCKTTYQNFKPDGGQCQTCKIVKYCSRECQNKGWKHPQQPHKLVCEILGPYSGRMTAAGVDWKEATKAKKSTAQMQTLVNRANVNLTESRAVYGMLAFFHPESK